MSYRRSALGIVIILMISAVFGAQAKDAKNAPPSEKIPTGAKVFVAPIADGFDTFLKDAIAKKKVPWKSWQVVIRQLRNNRCCRIPEGWGSEKNHLRQLAFAGRGQYYGQ